ncbi:hypothetical protein PPQ74_002534 [Salmonella enterica]|nr:hypothetical protein [Salmonella enterica]
MTINNHPAHGPVSLDRLHQIREILSKAASQSDGGNLGYAMADAVKVIDGAIASFGAEPVLYAMQGVKLDTDAISTCKNVVDGWVDEWNQERKPGVPEYKTVPLYTAPPAPVVPDDQADAFIAAIEKEQDRLHEEDYLMDSKDCIDVIREEVQRLNACRAVMLQSKYRDLSQPVDPQISEYEKIMLRAGWVMVPVEPTDEMIAAALDSHLIVFNPVKTYSVMLAAAPQPETSDGK